MNDWYKDMILYEIYPITFYDANGDGMGDFKGIEEKLEYLCDLGINTIWFSAFNKSAFTDAGYDVTDYYDVDGRFGNMEDLKSLLSQCKKRGVKVIMDMVLGHTSQEHPWFLASCKAERNKYSDYYIWTDSLIVGDEGCLANPKERDGCYRINYYATQPALNFGFEHSEPNKPWQWHYKDERLKPLREEIHNILCFWCDLGIDGFRFDMVPSLIKNRTSDESLVWLWNEILSEVKKEYPDVLFLAECGAPLLTVAKCGFELDYLFHVTPEYNDLLRNEPRENISRDYERGFDYFSETGKGSIENFLRLTSDILEKTSGKGGYVLPSGYHDTIRLGTYKSQDMLKAFYAFQMTYKCVPMLYYGDEIGMKHVNGLHKDGGSVRTGSRTPMHWTNGKNRGFSVADEIYLPVTDDANVSVESQAYDKNSLLNTVKALIALRKENKAFSYEGDLKVIFKEKGGYPIVYERSFGDSKFIVLLQPKAEEFILDVEYKQVMLQNNCDFTENKVIMKGAAFAILRE